MLASRSEIIHYIPQRDPFVALHDIIIADEQAAQTRFEITASSIFVRRGTMSEAGLIENIAQTAAAQMGYVCSKKGGKPPIGFITSVKNLSISRLPPVGAVITTSIHITNRIMDVVIFDAVILQDDKKICQCEMRVYIKTS